MIKVLIIMTDTNIGGAGKSVLQLLRNIDRRRFDVTVAVPGGSALVPYLENAGYTVNETERSRDCSFDIGAIFEYIRIIRRVRPDVVHTHSSLSGRIAAYLCGVKSRVFTKHCDIPVSTGFPIRQINGMLSTHVVAVCNAVAERVVQSGICRRKISVIPNGVSPVCRLSKEECIAFRKSHGIGRDDFVGLVSARLERCKGHPVLIETARILRGYPVKIVFMGEGSERDSLKRLCLAADVSDTVIFTGFEEDTAPWYNIADAILNSSLTEAMSLSVLEGMSIGKPAVVTDVGGNPEAVTDGVNGIVVPGGNSDAFADAILRLMNDRGLYAELSQGAEERYSTDFTSEIMTGRIMKLYEESVM